MKVADIVIQEIEKHANHVFCLVGGGSMHLNNALYGAKITPVFMLHEQGAAFAAQAYGHIHGLGVCMTTTGPGATNAITGCAAAWMDSTPVLFISGQCDTKFSNKDGLRYKGNQEVDIISMVEPITKLAVEIKDPSIARYAIRMAIDTAMTARMGPVWVSIPLDIQGAE